MSQQLDQIGWMFDEILEKSKTNKKEIKSTKGRIFQINCALKRVRDSKCFKSLFPKENRVNNRVKDTQSNSKSWKKSKKNPFKEQN